MEEPETTPKKRKPRKKLQSTTRLKREKILSTVTRMLNAGIYPGDIKRVVSKDNELSPRTIEGYLRRAREAKLAETGKPVEEHRSDSFAFYRSVVADPKATARDKIRAQQSIDRLLGLCQPVKVDSSGVVVELDPDKLSKMTDAEIQRLDSSLRALGRDGAARP